MSASSLRQANVLLSFSNGYAALAQRIAGALVKAGIAVHHDAWDGGGGAPAYRRITQGLDEVDFVLPLLTPSDATPTWIGDEWQRAVYAPACERGIAVLPLLGDGSLDAVPGSLRERSFADLRGRDADFELRRLLQTMQRRAPGIVLPPVAADSLGVRSPMEALAHPLTLDLGPALAGQAEDGTTIAARFEARLPFMYDGLFHELGVHFPALRLRTDAALPPYGVRVWVNEVPELQVEAVGGSLLVADSAEAMRRLGIDAQAALHPASGAPAAWIALADAKRVAQRGLIQWTASGFLELLVAAVLRRRAADFLGIADTQRLLGLIEPAFPQLLAETVPKAVSPFVLTDVLRRLLAEGVCIRDLPRILMALAVHGRDEADPLLLAEHCRAALRRQLTHTFSRGTKQIVVFLLEPEIEAMVREAMRHTATGSYLALAPQQLHELLGLIRAAMDALPAGVQTPQLLAPIDIRSSLRRLVAPSMPLLHALSYQDVRPDVDIQPIGRITRRGFSRRAGVRVDGELLWP